MNTIVSNISSQMISGTHCHGVSLLGTNRNIKYLLALIEISESR